MDILGPVSQAEVGAHKTESESLSRGEICKKAVIAILHLMEEAAML